MRGNSHVRFGERGRETHSTQDEKVRSAPTLRSGAFLFADFRKVLAHVAEHPNRSYFVFKSIIVNNLYGVDIMEEAVEICKLRLFLKLVAQVESADKIEPLPDIDFNIRAGNTLVGFATQEQVKQVITTAQGGQIKMLSGEELETIKRIDESAEIADRAFQKFREMQTEHGMEAKDFASAKQGLRERLKKLEDELNRYLATEYGVSPSSKAAYAKWLESHKPFHWFLEFYGILKQGGFDVIIGNPPWKEYSAVKKDYTVRGYATEGCGNLHGICTERALNLRSGPGSLSFIVQLPMVSSSRMASVRNLLRHRSDPLFVIPFDDRPGKLFDGLEHCRATIFVSRGCVGNESTALFTTRYQRWNTAVRDYLLAQLHYTKVSQAFMHTELFPKYANTTAEDIFGKVKSRGKQGIATVLSRHTTDHLIFYQESTGYWAKAIVGIPYYAKNGRISAPPHGRFIYFDKEKTAYIVCSLLNSSLFYLYYITYGDCFHLSEALVSGFPVPSTILEDESLIELGRRLTTSIKDQADRKSINAKSGDTITYAEFNVYKSKPVIDKIDFTLARNYGFSDDEADYIINYDIKYRMGGEAEDTHES
jgi:Eco57I restriction-modification methylase